MQEGWSIFPEKEPAGFQRKAFCSLDRKIEQLWLLNLQQLEQLLLVLTELGALNKAGWMLLASGIQQAAQKGGQS